MTLFCGHETEYMRENLGTVMFGERLQYPIEVGFLPSNAAAETKQNPAYLTAAVTDITPFEDKYVLIDPSVENSLESVKYLYWK